MTELIYWSGWIGGIAIGSYALLQFFLTGKVLGVSTAFSDLCSRVSKLSFFRQHKAKEQGFPWRIWFIIGIPLGSLIAAVTSPGPVLASFSLGPMYDSVLPESLPLKGLVLVFGGILIGYGSRMAGGCTSGHSIAGMSALNPPSFLASAGFFLGGIIMVQLLFNLF